MNGMDIYETPLLIVAKSRSLTWRERLTSWPWRPWVKTISWNEPDPNFYVAALPGVTGGNRKVIFAHPETARTIRAEITRQETNR